MADSRPWAKIDTGYMFNPKWFQVERELRETMANSMASAMASANGKTDKLPEVCHSVCHEVAISNALRCAREAHLASILYSAQNQTDGTFPVRAIKTIAGVQTEAEEAAITALFTVGMWRNLAGGMAEVHDYLEHQTPASLTKTRSEAGKKGAKARWQNNGKSHEVANGKTMATANAEEKRREEKEVARADVLEILDYLDSKLLTLDVKLPNRNKTNLQEARRLLDVDHKTVTQVKACIDYAMDDPFWSTTCLSIKSLRKSYDRISLQARGKQNTRQAVPALVRAGDLDD